MPSNDALGRICFGVSNFLAPEIASIACRLERICESPIEVMLGTAIYWTDRVLGTPPIGGNLIIVKPEDMPTYVEADSWQDFFLICQFPWKDKRIDFALARRRSIIFVECDGHDFHERTKAQAARDRKKDRDCQRSHIPILRFTGSEIYSDPSECAREVLDFFDDFQGAS